MFFFFKENYSRLGNKNYEGQKKNLQDLVCTSLSTAFLTISVLTGNSPSYQSVHSIAGELKFKCLTVLSYIESGLLALKSIGSGSFSEQNLAFSSARTPFQYLQILIMPLLVSELNSQLFNGFPPDSF